jgi:hypothetical protein
MMIFVLVLVAGISFTYKRYIDARLRNGPSAWNITSTFNRFASFHNLIPNEIDKFDSKDRNLVKNGNLALVIFYTCFALVILIALFHALF